MDELLKNKILDDYRIGFIEAKNNKKPYTKCKTEGMNNVYKNNQFITKDNIRKHHDLMSGFYSITREFFPEHYEKNKEIELNKDEPFSKTFVSLVENLGFVPNNKFWETLYEKQFNIASYFQYVNGDYDRQKTEHGYIFTKNINGKIAKLEEEYEELVKEFNQAGLDGNMPKVFQLVNKMEEIKKQIAKLNG